jgi:hypothetical protein
MAKDDWIEHDGKGMPVGGDVRVEVRVKDGTEYDEEDASWWGDGGVDSNWNHTYPTHKDITHYRIVKENDNA